MALPPGSNGNNYSWRVRGTDGSLTGAYSSWCEFTVDTAEPTTAPGVSSTTVPDNTWTGAPPTYTVTTAAKTYVDGATTLPLTGDDAVTSVALPFTVNFFNQPYNEIWVDTDGMLFFTDPGGPVLTPCCANLPNVGSPDAVLYAFTDDLLVDASASVRTAVVGSAPNRQFVVDWHNVARFDNQTQRLNVEVLLSEDGTITYDYSSLDNNDEKGANALVGLEDQTGSQGVPYGQYQPVLANNTSVVFHPAQLSVTGYTAATATRTYTPASTVTTLSADDATLLPATPFPIKYYGNTYNQLWIDTNGQIDFVNPNGSNSEHLVPLPDPAQPNGTVNVFGDDLNIDAYFGTVMTVPVPGCMPSRASPKCPIRYSPSSSGTVPPPGRLPPRRSTRPREAVAGRSTTAPPGPRTAHPTTPQPTAVSPRARGPSPLHRRSGCARPHARPRQCPCNLPSRPCYDGVPADQENSASRAGGAGS